MKNEKYYKEVNEIKMVFLYFYVPGQLTLPVQPVFASQVANPTQAAFPSYSPFPPQPGFLVQPGFPLQPGFPPAVPVSIRQGGRSFIDAVSTDHRR